MCLDGAMGNDNQLIKAELDKLEQGHVDDLTLTEAIKWLYMRFRDKCVGLWILGRIHDGSSGTSS